MSLKYQVVPVTSFSQNCSIVWCDETMEGIVVDLGGRRNIKKKKKKEHGVRVVNLVLTHGNLDHVSGPQPLSDEVAGAKIVGHHTDDRT